MKEKFFLFPKGLRSNTRSHVPVPWNAWKETVEEGKEGNYGRGGVGLVGTREWKVNKWTTIWQCRLGTCLIIIYTQITTNWQVVGFFLYHLLFPQIESHSYQNLPFCSPEHGKQGHNLLTDTTPTSPQLSFQPFPLLPPLSNQIGKFLVPGMPGNGH